jgi:phosphoadenosine phosphosulfate reductase
MRRILRRRDLVEDSWRYLGEEVAAGDPLIVPLADLRAERERWWNWAGRLGARLQPSDRVEDLAANLPRLDLVAVEFPNPGDGRGYSQGRLLRERLRFRGELRAMGAGVREDQAFLLARCGFDSLEPPAGANLEAVRDALSRYDVAYQPGATWIELRRQRFFASGGGPPPARGAHFIDG